MDLSLWLSLATALAGTILLARLMRLDLVRRFSGLTFYISQHILWGYTLILIPESSQASVWAYETSNVVEWFAATWCVVHLLGRIFDAYPGIRTLSRWVAWGAIGLSVCAALTVARVFWSGGIGGRKLLFYFEVADRSVLLSLALVVILTLGFLSRYPLGLQTNTWASLTGFSAVVLSLAGARLVDSLAPQLASRQIDRAQLAFEAFTYLVWAWKLRRQEQQEPARVIFHHIDEADLLAELKAMNGILRRAPPS